MRYRWTGSRRTCVRKLPQFPNLYEVPPVPVLPKRSFPETPPLSGPRGQEDPHLPEKDWDLQGVTGVRFPSFWRETRVRVPSLPFVPRSRIGTCDRSGARNKKEFYLERLPRLGGRKSDLEWVRLSPREHIGGDFSLGTDGVGAGSETRGTSDGEGVE